MLKNYDLVVRLGEGGGGGIVQTPNCTDTKSYRYQIRPAKSDLPWGVLVFLNLCKMLVSARFCEVCAR